MSWPLTTKFVTESPPHPYLLEYRKPSFRWTVVKFVCMMELRILHRQNLPRQEILPNSTFKCGQLLYASLYLAFNFVIRRAVPSFSQNSSIIWNVHILTVFTLSIRHSHLVSKAGFWSEAFFVSWTSRRSAAAAVASLICVQLPWPKTLLHQFILWLPQGS